jgi:hypothetical protein
MSFFRHEEIYPCEEGATLPNRAPAHRNDESPAGYSSAGCAPAEPASASPASAIIIGLISSAKIFAANGKLSLISLSQLRGAVQENGGQGKMVVRGKWWENGGGKMVSGTCEEMCFEKRRVEMAVAPGVRDLGC